MTKNVISTTRIWRFSCNVTGRGVEKSRFSEDQVIGVLKQHDAG